MRIQTPIARNTHPETSHQAAEYMNKSGKRQKQIEECVEYVLFWPRCTSRELEYKSTWSMHAFKLRKLTHEQLHKRLPDAVTAGLIKKGPARKCTITGRMACVWLPV